MIADLFSLYSCCGQSATKFSNCLYRACNCSNIIVYRWQPVSSMMPRWIMSLPSGRVPLVMCKGTAGQIRGVVADEPNKPVNGFIFCVGPFGLDGYVDRFPGLFPVRFDLNNVMFDSVRFHIAFGFWGRLPGPGFNYSTTVTTWVTFIALPRVPGFPALRHARSVYTFPSRVNS